MGDPAATLRSENDALRRALRLLFDVANLVRNAEEPDATAYAVLTAVTAGVGLGMNRAMLFEPHATVTRVLVGRAAVGPASREEADRVWRAIEREAPDLETLYEAGLRAHREPSALDHALRALRIEIDGEGSGTPVALAVERAIFGEGDAHGDVFDPATTIAAPMRGREGLRGVLLADNRWTGVVPDAVTRMVFTMVADHAGRALFAAERFARVAEEARVDALTGLASRRAGLALLDQAIANAAERGRPVAVLMLDVDRFKSVNDEHGHDVGDAVLRELGRRVRELLDRGARAFRYGGEEIAIVASDHDLDAAHALAERIRTRLRDERYVVGSGLALRVTCSIGVAASPPSALDSASLSRAADQALLRAKQGGRDRTVTSES